MLPNVIGIGAQRSATTWIYEMLRNHPSVFMSPEKEINFFNTNYDKGVEWYKKFFRKSGTNKVIGEYSPTYLSHELAPERMRRLLPGARLIVSLRNPVDQILSRYHYMVTRQMYKGTFEDALKEKQFLIEDALYYKHLKRYLRHFEQSWILILIYEDLRVDPRSFLQKIYSFLEIDDDFIPCNVNERFHFTRLPKSIFVETSLSTIRRFLSETRLHSLVQILKQIGLVNTFKKINTKRNGNFENISSTTRSLLNDIFRNENEMLSTMLGRDLSIWK